MIRSLLARGLMLLVLVAATGARADDATPLTEADRNAIRAVIEAQIAAFRADDGVTAFSFASPSIQRQFGDPVNFLTMVRTGYMPVYRPREVQFRALIEDRSEPVQPVLLVGPELEVVTAYYVMQKQPDGTWRIDGCVLRQVPERAL
jgi:Domain of unknown function (DUF4864)